MAASIINASPYAILFIAILTCCPAAAAGEVSVHVEGQHVVLDNGILQLILSNPGGSIIGVKYNGIDNLLEDMNREDDRGYWDVVWNDEGNSGMYNVIQGAHFQVIHEEANQVEVSFRTNWNHSLKDKLVPLKIDKRFVLLHGCSGFYTYAIYEHLQGWPEFEIAENRMALKLRKDKFHYMATADNRQRTMPMPDDRMPGRSQQLAYPEAVLLTDPINRALKGEVDDKYQYSSDNKDNKVHGWICDDPPTGFWLVTPSNEFKTGGPLKQDLTSHVGPTILAMFGSSHYSGEDNVSRFRNGEYWKKVFGPVFIYLNSALEKSDLKLLWDDAKKQMEIEVENWPYKFPISEDFQKSEERGFVHGRLLIYDKFNTTNQAPIPTTARMGLHSLLHKDDLLSNSTRYINKDYIDGDSAFVGMASPGESGSWQRETKGYQFWVRADAKGNFIIKNVRSGVYNLYAWVPGFIGEYKSCLNITVTPGGEINLGNLVYEPPREGPTFWEIGIPDRSAAEFFVPDPNPSYVNRLYLYHPDSRFKQYGLWERYSDMYPNADLTYTVGVSDYRKDWFFAQVTRKNAAADSYQPTTWQIKFRLDAVHPTGNYKLQLALASAHLSELQVRFNEVTAQPPHFTTELIGRDNSIARHGIHGLYWLFSINVQSRWLLQGDNTIFLSQTRSQTAFQGIMYDYIRMEAPTLI